MQKSWGAEERGREMEANCLDGGRRGRRGRRRRRSRGKAGFQSVRSQEESAAAAAGQWTVFCTDLNRHWAAYDTLEHKVRSAANSPSVWGRTIQITCVQMRWMWRRGCRKEATQSSRQTPSRACCPSASGSYTGQWHHDMSRTQQVFIRCSCMIRNLFLNSRKTSGVPCGVFCSSKKAPHQTSL